MYILCAEATAVQRPFPIAIHNEKFVLQNLTNPQDQFQPSKLLVSAKFSIVYTVNISNSEFTIQICHTNFACIE